MKKHLIHIIDGFTYICKENKQPDLNTFVIQGQVKRIYFYTDDKIKTEDWFKSNNFSRKYKIDKWTREIILTDDGRLTNVEKIL
jgi:hypothetical protein